MATATAGPTLLPSTGWPEAPPVLTLTETQAARKQKLITEHPLYSKRLQCADMGVRWAAEVSRAKSLAMRWAFAFLIMGEDDTRSKEAVMWSDNSDVFRLTYKTQMEDAIFCPDLVFQRGDQRAFGRGRNTLLVAAHLEELRRGWAYEYYVFMDSDVESVPLPGDAADVWSWRVSLDRFKMFLHEWRPAIGMPLYVNEAVPILYTHLFLLEMGRARHSPNTVYWYDQMFIAVHRQAAERILPLDVSLDMKDSQISQWNMTITAALLYRGHMLLCKGMALRNPVHAREPDNEIEMGMRGVSAMLRAKVPPRLRHCILTVWNTFAFSFSSQTFSARHVTNRSRRLRPGENGYFYIHSYYPWGTAVHKRWNYATATLDTSPTCDDEPDHRNFWWGSTCDGPQVQPMERWLGCARHAYPSVTP
eukprot:TRINITY_DN43762_c0_g1_i1.p1 TRINITY_DN43762_c0_g1~~TRINITY_DN43762_c0_g1_i1.p1  ORF type:complete len:419 (+),score=58.58 TRINITY_DN43762_c0_g1_i1:45-1301(+)